MIKAARRITLISLLALAAIHSAHAATAQTYDLALTITTDAGTFKPRLLVRAAEPATVTVGDKGEKITASFIVSAAGAGSAKVDCTIKQGATTLGHPIVIAHLGERAGVKVQGDAGTPSYELGIVVSEVTNSTAPK